MMGTARDWALAAIAELVARVRRCPACAAKDRELRDLRADLEQGVSELLGAWTEQSDWRRRCHALEATAGELRRAARRVLAEADATTSVDPDELTAEWREALSELRAACGV